MQAVLRPDGLPVGVADVEPGSTPDLTAARPHLLGALYWAAAQLRLPTLADDGYRSTGIGVHTLVPNPADDGELDSATCAYNLLLRSLRCRGEHGLALLTGQWRTLQHVTLNPSKIGHIAKATLVLTHVEHGYPTA